MQIIGQICDFDTGVPLFATLVRGEPLNSGPRNTAWLQPEETRNIALSYGVHIFTDNYLVLSQCTRLTDRQTDRQTYVDSKTVRMLRSRTVKIRKLNITDRAFKPGKSSVAHEPVSRIITSASGTEFMCNTGFIEMLQSAHLRFMRDEIRFKLNFIYYSTACSCIG